MEENKGSLHSNLTINGLTLGVVVYSYAVLLGACYLFAFWRPFGFNVFPWLGLSDYISSPLNRLPILVLTPLISMGFVIFSWNKNKFEWPFAVCIVASFVAISFDYLVKGYQLYNANEFRFNNEASAIFFSCLLTGFGLLFFFCAYASSKPLIIQVASIVAMQAGIAMSVGYVDGKQHFIGADRVFFLENREICEKNEQYEWVLLGKFSKASIFMNTIDKRLCLTDEGKYRLISRSVQEKI